MLLMTMHAPEGPASKANWDMHIALSALAGHHANRAKLFYTG